MSRIRTVKPDLFRHEELFDAELSSGLPLRLAFVGLFTVADCAGRFIWKPRTIKLDVLPHDAVDFAAVLAALEQHGFIRSYIVEGVKYGFIPSFTKHQRLQTKEIEAGSSFPDPSLDSGTKPENIQVRTGCVPENIQVRTGTQPEAQEGEEEGKGREEERKENISAQAPDAQPADPALPITETAATPDVHDADFATFWDAYPQRAGGNPKPAALKAWKARRKDGHAADRMIAGAVAYADYCLVTGKLQTEYVKQASTFINQLGFLEAWTAPKAAPGGGRASRPAVNHGDSRISEAESILQNIAKPPIEGIAYVAH